MTKPITTKSELKEKWNYYKDIPNRYNNSDDKFRDLLKDAYKLVDISDLDNWIENYDFNRKGDGDYHKIMGKKFLGWGRLNQDYEEYPDSVSDFYPEYGLGALEKMAQQVAARCYIEMYRLLQEEREESWKTEMNRIATNWTSSSLERKFEEKTTEAERERLTDLIQEKINIQQTEVR